MPLRTGGSAKAGSPWIYDSGIGRAPPKTLDLARQDDEETATEDLLAARSVDLGDFFAFVIERTAKLDAVTDGAAIRYRVTALLAGRDFDSATLDIGFGDPLVPTPDYLPGPSLLGFAGLNPISVPALPLEGHVAAKAHAYTRSYGVQRAISSVTAPIALVPIPSVAGFDAGRLQRALRATFATRDTHPMPTALPAPPADWGPAYRATAAEIAIDPGVATGHRLAAAFLDPVLGDKAADDARWRPESGAWESEDATPENGNLGGERINLCSRRGRRRRKPASASASGRRRG